MAVQYYDDVIFLFPFMCDAVVDTWPTKQLMPPVVNICFLEQGEEETQGELAYLENGY